MRGRVLVQRGFQMATRALAERLSRNRRRLEVHLMVAVQARGDGDRSLEDRPGGAGLGDVADVGGGAVGVDVVDLGGGDAGVAQAEGHGAAHAGLGRGGDVEAVAVGAVAEDLAEDGRAAGPGVLPVFEDQGGGAFDHVEQFGVGLVDGDGLGLRVGGVNLKITARASQRLDWEKAKGSALAEVQITAEAGEKTSKSKEKTVIDQLIAQLEKLTF